MLRRVVSTDPLASAELRKSAGSGTAVAESAGAEGLQLRAAAAHVNAVKVRLSLAAAAVILVLVWLPWHYRGHLLQHAPHHVHHQRLAVGREAMLRHAPHYEAFRRRNNATNSYKIGMVADMDRVSKINVAKNSAWMSIFKTLLLLRDGDGQYSVKWLEEIPLVSRLSEADRGMELSELLYFHDKLLAFSDRTGVIYEVHDGKLVPLWILSDHDGKSEDGFKSEWATVKDDILYVGSTGKPWLNDEGGKVMHTNRLWIKSVTLEGKIEHHSWVHVYEKILNVTGMQFIVHEAVNWNPIDRRWYFLPRRMSKEEWSMKTDGVGSFVMISCSEEFEDWKVWELGKYQPGHGYSSFKFVPFREHEIIALKTVEDGDNVHTDFEVIDTEKGKVLLHERLGLIKFEGIEFVR